MRLQFQGLVALDLLLTSHLRLLYLKRSFTAQQQPEGFKDEIKLYKYQLDAISWMKSVELNTEGTQLSYQTTRAKYLVRYSVLQSIHLARN